MQEARKQLFKKNLLIHLTRILYLPGRQAGDIYLNNIHTELEIGPFMPNSSVFIFLMLRAPYGSITQHLLFLNEI